MNANRTPLGDLFQRDVRFETPLFQRPYVWTRSRNWEPLWSSLAQLATQQLRHDGDRRPYFLGAIVIEQLDRPAGRVTAWQIIDGQQRLTTLQLALSQWERLAREKGEAQLADVLAGLTKNQLISRRDPDERFKVWPTNVDRTAFRSVMTDGTGGTGLLAEAARYFRDAADQWVLASGASVRDALEALISAVMQRLDLVEIRLDHKDDAQQIFETLNALGTPLLPADLVKNYLLRALPESEAVELYEKAWRPFEDGAAYWRAPLRPGRQRVTRLDLFLQNYLVVVRGESARASELFAEYRTYFAASGLTPAQELAKVRAYADAYERFDRLPERDAQSPLGIAMRRLQGLEATTIYPLVLEAFRRLGDDDLLTFLGVLESFLVRRMVCRLSTRGYNELFVSALRELVTTEFSSAALTAFLLRGREETSRWPSSAEFQASWTGNELYRNLRSQRLQVIFDALERTARSDKVEPIVYTGALTIEHLLPQSWTEQAWPLPGDRPHHEAEAEREHLLHTIGNLAAITQKLNSAQSNSPWPTKRTLLEQYSVSILNRALPAAWSDADIEPRSRQLFEVAKRAWSRPASDHDEDWRSHPAVPDPVSPDAPEADRQAAYREFLRALFEEMKELRPDITTAAGGGGPGYYGFPAGGGDARFHWSFAAGNRFRVEVYIDPGRKSTAPKELFDALYADRAAIDAAIGIPISWERLDQARASRIATYREGNVFDDPELYHELREWGIDAMTRFADVLMPLIPKSVEPPVARALRTMYADAIASAQPEAQEIERRLVAWAEREGHKSVPAKTARRFETADGTRLMYLYPEAGYVEFRLKTLRDVGMDTEADGILATLGRYAGASRSGPHPSVPCGKLLEAWNDFESTFLPVYVMARRAAASRKSNAPRGDVHLEFASVQAWIRAYMSRLLSDPPPRTRTSFARNGPYPGVRITGGALPLDLYAHEDYIRIGIHTEDPSVVAAIRNAPGFELVKAAKKWFTGYIRDERGLAVVDMLLRDSSSTTPD